jgi:hypothetical protein
MVSVSKPGGLGIALTLIGVVLLLFTFSIVLRVFESYFPLSPASSDFLAMMNLLLGAAVQALFLGLMGWLASILILRGVDFLKVEKGVGVVTFRVEKGVGIVGGIEGASEKPPKQEVDEGG